MSSRGRSLEFPTRFRRRLSLFCTGAVAVATAMFGLGSFLFIREDKLERFEAMATREAQLRASVASTEQPDPSDAAGVLAALGSAEAVIIGANVSDSSSPMLDRGDVPLSLVSGESDVDIVNVDGSSYLVVAADGLPYRAFLFFDRDPVLEDVRMIGEILAVAWVLVVGLAALGCGRLARRALWPVREAAEVARNLADGLLDLRMPVDGDDEFAAWAWEFNRMVDELERRIERERRFTADVAHELRTPLGSLATAASLLHGRLQQLPDNARRPAELLVQEVRRLRALVDDLLEISRAAGAEREIDVSYVELAQRVSDVLESRGWSQSVRVEGTSVRVRTDARRFDRVVANLVDNAIRHGGAPVTITVGARDDYATVTVIDEGPGIPQHQRERIFEPFYKGDSSRPGPGSGLGLAIALEHARALGGRIEVESDLGRGSRFRLYLPVAESREETRRSAGF